MVDLFGVPFGIRIGEATPPISTTYISSFNPWLFNGKSHFFAQKITCSARPWPLCSEVPEWDGLSCSSLRAKQCRQSSEASRDLPEKCGEEWNELGIRKG